MEMIYTRKIYLKAPVQVTFTGICPIGTNLLLPRSDVFQEFPLSSIMNNISLKLNNTQNQISLKDGIHALMHYHNSGCLR